MADNGPDPRQLGWYYALAQVGFEMVVPIAAGWGLDNWLGTAPWILVVGTILGPLVGFAHLLSLLKQKPPEDDKP